MAEFGLSVVPRDIQMMFQALTGGSAVLLEEAGFKAIATTSSGVAYALGRPDYQARITREETVAVSSRIAAAVDIPVSIDAESGYGPTADDVAETVRQLIDKTHIDMNLAAAIE